MFDFPKGKSVSQSLSALCTTSLENVSAVSGLHSLSETVLLLSLTLFRLISSKHVWHLLADQYRKRIVSQPTFSLLHNDIIYYKHKMPELSSLF